MQQYGLQMYSVRDLTSESLSNALKQVAEIGYSKIEFAGFFGHSAEEVKAMLNEYGLTVCGSHSGFDELERDFAAAVRYHHTLGNTSYIIPYTNTDTTAAVMHTVELINKYQPLLAAEGITLAYHNHAHEFKPNTEGVIPHTLLEQNTDVSFEIDTYWAFVAGLDPVETITRLKERTRIVHLRDGSRDSVSFALGEGEAPVAAVRKRAVELGMSMVVESAGLQPTGIGEATRCINYLRSLEG